MKINHHRRAQSNSRDRKSNIIEPLEPRMLLSASFLTSRNLTVTPATTSNPIPGFTPAQIRHAYGFDQLTIGNNSVPADGAGQTIAIVDAYDDPTIKADLATFDNQFGIAPPTSFNIVDQQGGQVLPVANSDWDGEISLDVEWSHAIAPAANILLIETNTQDMQDLMAGVLYARTVPGVSVVSMSWGGAESFPYLSGAETVSQVDENVNFTTPVGHQGITFIAAAGDSGAAAGLNYPAASPNVLSVGGTSLYLNNDGSYQIEAGWAGTNSGESFVQSEPGYQAVAQNTGARTVPDVSYDGDPITGFAVYDSIEVFGSVGWQDVGGTSAGSPQWAGLIAIADQSRALLGMGSLDGASQTLPLLYDSYAPPSSPQYAQYTDVFNDVTAGGEGRIHWKWGFGINVQSAAPGYDESTGLGTPHAQGVVNILSGIAPPVITGGNGTNGGTGTVQQAAQSLPASPLSVSISDVPSSALGSAKGKLVVTLSESQTPKFSGPVSIAIYASTDKTFSDDDTIVTTMMVPRANLRQGVGKNVTLKFDYPSALANGNYFLLANADAISTNTAVATAVSPAAVSFTGPTVDIAASFDGPVAVVPGKSASGVLILSNLGNVLADGSANITLYSSTDKTLDASDTVIAAIPGVKIRIKPGHSKKVHVRFIAPAKLAAGSYNLIASVDPLTVPTDLNTANNVAVTLT